MKILFYFNFTKHSLLLKCSLEKSGKYSGSARTIVSSSTDVKLCGIELCQKEIAVSPLFQVLQGIRYKNVIADIKIKCITNK